MRCLALAQGLQNKAKIAFIISYESSEFEGYIKSLLDNVRIFILPESAYDYQHEQIFSNNQAKEDALNTKNFLDKTANIDWLIIDHYGIDKKWEEYFYSESCKIMVIDDLANREHYCDILLDQNQYIDYADRYDSLVPSECLKLLGCKYALLREEFSTIEKSIIGDDVKNILISFGGSDFQNTSYDILNVLKDSKYKDIEINIVAGSANIYKSEIKTLCNHNAHFTYHEQINYMAKLMSDADLFIGAGGATTLERIAMGLPSIVFSVAGNQTKICEDLKEQNIVQYAGFSSEFNADNFKNILDDTINNSNWRKSCNKKSLNFLDGRGVKKVVDFLLKNNNILFLGNSNSPLISFIEKTARIIQTSDKVTKEFILKEGPDFLVSYNYKYIIGKDILDLFNENNAINLHISYLPYNRGSDPNFWSFIDNTPKGITIHLIDEGIDTGEILIQKEVVFENEESQTLETTYNKLHEYMIELFKKSWSNILLGHVTPRKQEGVQTFHYSKDKDSMFESLDNIYDIKINKIKQLYKTNANSQ